MRRGIRTLLERDYLPLSSNRKALPKTVKVVPALIDRGSTLTVSVMTLALQSGWEEAYPAKT